MILHCPKEAEEAVLDLMTRIFNRPKLDEHFSLDESISEHNLLPKKVQTSPLRYFWDFGGSVLWTSKEITLTNEEGLPVSSPDSAGDLDGCSCCQWLLHAPIQLMVINICTLGYN